MEKPSPQFVKKLEKNLRMAYRSDFNQAASRAAFHWNKLFKFALPIFSGALLLMAFTFNLLKNPFAHVETNDFAEFNTANNTGVTVASLNELQSDENFLNTFDGDELKSIDRGVQLAVADNF